MDDAYRLTFALAMLVGMETLVENVWLCLVVSMEAAVLRLNVIAVWDAIKEIGTSIWELIATCVSFHFDAKF